VPFVSLAKDFQISGKVTFLLLFASGLNSRLPFGQRIRAYYTTSIGDDTGGYVSKLIGLAPL